MQNGKNLLPPPQKKIKWAGRLLLALRIWVIPSCNPHIMGVRPLMLHPLNPRVDRHPLAQGRQSSHLVGGSSQFFLIAFLLPYYKVWKAVSKTREFSVLIRQGMNPLHLATQELQHMVTVSIPVPSKRACAASCITTSKQGDKRQRMTIHYKVLALSPGREFWMRNKVSH